MGNICRSPTAQGVFEHLVTQAGLAGTIAVDSAGTHAYHVGNPPDMRSQQTARARGVDISGQRARQVESHDFERFDYVLAMDQQNMAILMRMCPETHKHKVKLFMEFAPELGIAEVPDPYYGGTKGFEHVFDLVQSAAQGLLQEICSRQL